MKRLTVIEETWDKAVIEVSNWGGTGMVNSERALKSALEILSVKVMIILQDLQELKDE